MPFSNKQLDFLARSNADINITAGSVSAGKTHITNIRWVGYIYLDAPPGSLLTMIGRTLGSLYDNCIRFMEDNDTHDDMKFIKAKEGIVTRIKIISRNIDITCAGADNAASWKSVQGKTHAGAYLDEVTNLPKTLVQTIVKGARHEGQDWPVFMTTNPDVPRHYVRQDYILNKELNINHWHFTLEDNPVLTEAYKKKIRSIYTGAAYRRFILGEWVSGAEATVFHNFDRSINVVEEPIKYDPEAEIVTTWDFGVADMTAVIVMQIREIPEAPNGVIIEILDSYQDRNKGSGDYRIWGRSREWFNNYKRRDTGDPSGKARSHDLSSWIVGLQPDFTIEPPPPHSVKDFVFNSLIYMPSIRINERQNPDLLEVLENWSYGPVGDDETPLPGAKPIHDDYSHFGTALYYGLAYRFPIDPSFKIMV